MAPRRKQAQINEQPTQQQGTEPDQGPPLPAEGDYPPVPDETFAGAPTGERIIPVWAKIISGSQLAAFLVLLGYLWLLAIDPAAGKSLGKRARLPAPLERIAVTDWARVLPPHATNLSHAWELGIAEGTLASSLENGLSKKVVEAAAAQAVNLLVGSGFGANFSSDTEKEPAKVLDAIRQAKMTTMATENKKGLVSFVKNAFSLANALWLIGILGVTASISPVLVFALPSVVGFLMRFWMMAWQYLRPIWWLTWRPVLYYFAAGAFSSAGNTEISLDVRVYSLLTVAIFCGAAAAYTMMILSLLDMVTKDAAESLVFAFACGLLVPLAHILSSKLLGFLAVLCFFSACGMGMRAFPGGYVIGFTSRSALDRSVVVSLAIVSFSVLVRLSGSDKLESLFAPFSSGMQVFGASAFYLAFLIKSSSLAHGFDGPAASLMAIALVAGIVVGALVGLVSLRNTAFVFSYLFALDVIMWLSGKQSVWLGIFVASIMLTVAAYALHSRPHVLVALYSAVDK